MDQVTFKGIRLAFGASVISGVAVFVNKFGVGFWANSSAYTTVKNLAAAVFLTALFILAGKIGELKKLSMSQWRRLLLIALVGGSVPFLLFFRSLTMVSATEAAFIHKTLFLWVALFSYPFLKERLGALQGVALVILLVGVFLSGAPSTWTFGLGFALSLAATILWGAENIIAKKALSEISPEILGWARMFFGSLILLVWLLVSGDIASVVPTSATQALWTLATGATLFGFVALWYSALRYAPATTVAAILVLAAPITTLLDSVLVKHSFPSTMILPFGLLLFGALLISKSFGYLYSKFSSGLARA